MADEQNRAPEETPDNINEPETFSPEEEAAPPARRWLSRRNVLIGIGIPLLLIVLVAVAGFLYIRLGYAGRYIERNFVAQMDKAGVRTEIGKFETSFAPLGVIMRDVKFFDKVTGEQLAKVDYLKLDATVTDLLAPNLNRTIRLDSTEVEGLEAWVRFDEEGRSNFSRLKIPEQEQSNLTFAYSTMKFSLKNSIVHYGDVNRKISGDARNVSLFVEPDEGLSESEREVENRRFKFNLAATDSTLTYDDKLVEPIDVGVRGVWAETYADIAELTLKTPFTESRLNGRLENWEHLRYKLNVESNVDLQQAGATFKSETALRGFGNFVGVVEGEGDNYKVTGSIVSDTLAADNVRLRGLRVDASVAGEDDTYEANGKAVAEMLTYGDFQLNLMQIAGKVMGTGTDFRWMGDLRAAAARFPDGSVAQLILSDAVAEYRDERLTADIGAASAQTLEAFDAKLRGVRAVNARITDANGVTNATIGNARVANLERKGTVLRGVNASNVRVRDAQSTDVQIGRLQAQNLQDSGVNVNDLNAANVTINSRGNNIDATAGTVTAANLQKSDTRVRDLRAGNVTINSRGNRTLVNAGTVTATNVDAEAGRLQNLRAANVDIDNFGNTTNVIAANVQIGGVQTPRATLGSLNIAGVRLKVVGERIEGTSSDFSAGNVALARSESLPEGGRLENVRVSRPVFVLEPSGRYRASLDLSLGGGALGSIRVGAARAAVVATSSRVELSNLNAQIMEGNVRGNANISLDNRGSSQIAASFENLDVAKLLTLAGGQVAPISGTTTGEANLTFPGTNVRAASGTLNADFIAEAGNDERGRVPLTGRLALRATNGLFDVETARFQTGQTELNATGRFDLEGVDSNLQVALNSSNAKELQRLISALDVAPALDQQLAQNKIELDGNVAFTGTLRGNLENPTIEGRASLESISANNRALGSFSTNLFVSPAATELRDAVLAESDGGQVRFNLIAPRVGTNNISVDATLTGVDAGNIIAALPFSGVPDFLRQLRAETTGRIQLSGLPDQIEGFAEISSGAGTIGGESFDSFNTRVAFANSVAQIERFEARFDQGTLTANGTYNTATEVFNLNAEARNIPAQKIRAFLGENASSIPNINGTLDLTASGTGEGSNFRTYNINFDGVGRGVTIDNRDIGDVTFVGRTQNQQLTANINASLNGQPLVAKANVNFADENLPFRAETVFDNTDLAPIASLIQQQGSVRLAGRATGTAVFGGNLRSRDEQGNLVFSTQNLRGEARFTELQLQVEDVILNATNPLTIRFTPTEVAFDNATFTGTGSNLTINGTAVLSGNGENNLIARGTLNLRVLNALASDQFFGGIAAVDIRVSGSSSNT
ncbi:MAG TPA: hypothetical protein VEX64_05715, partial [Pyrinomonadaceae bacterium]|nr:hypothetical protein [Pyrinomonadaceae bacterium]